MEVIKQRTKESFFQKNVDYSKLLEYYHEDGFFTDTNYESQARQGWEPAAKHLVRTVLLAQGCMYDKNCPFYKDEKTIKKMLKLAEFYVKLHPICANWWYNDIFVPHRLSAIYLFAEELLSDEIKNLIVGFLVDKVDGNSAGANQVWLSEVILYKALFTKDEALLKRSVGHIADEVYMAETPLQGIKPDFAFTQHRLQLYNHGYGIAFLTNTSKWVKILAGTDYEFPKDKIELLMRMLVDGCLKMGRYNQKDSAARGRGIAGHGAADGLMESYIPACENLLYYANKEDEAFINRFLGRMKGEKYTHEDNFNKSYPSVAYMTHNRKSFYSSLRFATKDMRGSEVINSENLIGGFQSFGYCAYMKSGEEYDEIYPVWDFGCIPGTTTPHAELSPVLENQDTEFAKVLSDGLYGFGASDIIKTYKDSEVVVTPTGYLEKYVDENAGDIHFGGRKATFFFDSQVVHLGNSLYCDHYNNYHTTADQCILKGDVTADGRALERCDNLRETNAKCVTHNGVVYKILDNNTFTVKNGKQIGSYTRIENVEDTPKGTIEKDVFTILINHGINAENKSYEYIVFPDGETENAQIVSNNDIQAVFCDNILCIVFYKAGTLEFHGKKITADKACLAMVKDNEILVDDAAAKVKLC